MIDFIQNIDMSVIRQLYTFQHTLNSDLFDKIMIFFTHLGDNGFIWIVISLFLLLSKKHRKTGILSIVSLVIGAIAVNLLLKPLLQRARPFSEISDIMLLIKAPKDYSFPSGHTTASFTMVYVFFKKMKKYSSAVLIVASLIAFSRMYLNVHYPSDIIVGLLIGLFSGSAGKKIIKKIRKFKI